MKRESAVLLEQVSKDFGGFSALKQIDLRIPQRSFLLLAGSNGAGKTTLLRLLAGLSKPSRGRVLIEGEEPYRHPTCRASIGLLSHTSLLYEDLTAQQNLLFFARLYRLDQPQQRIARALDRVDLETRQHSLVRTFSRGMKQRLALARATLHQPAILLLDEPYTGLDQRSCQRLTRDLARLEEMNCTAVMVTHKLDEAIHLMDHLVLLKEGRLCYDAPCKEANLSTLEDLYREHLEDNP